MAVYEYTGVNAKGKQVKGSQEADSPRTLRDALKAQGIFLTTAVEGKDAAKSSRDIQLPWANRVSTQDVAITTRMLATQSRAGIPLATSLTALVEQTESAPLKRVLAEVRQDVNEGLSLAVALAKHPKAFSPLYINMIRAGESSGNLDLVLQRLAVFLEDQNKLQGKVVGAMIYPLLMMVMAGLIVSFLMISVVPKITEVYADQGQALPFITRLLIGVSGFLGSWKVIFLIAAIVGAVIGFRRWVASEEGRKQWDKILLKIPVAGELIRLIAMARFSRTLSTLLGSGVQLLPAMDIVKNILGNTTLVSVVEQARLNIREGESIAVPLRRSGEFPPMMTHMISVGEQTGALEAMLENVAETYESQVDSRIEAMTSLLEPLMIIGMGGSVGFIVFAIISPILQLSQGTF